MLSNSFELQAYWHLKTHSFYAANTPIRCRRQMEDGGRAQRQAVVNGRGGSKFKNALAELAELRKTGAKRADLYEFKEETAVYDEVDEDEYARIVQKRREEGGAWCGCSA